MNDEVKLETKRPPWECAARKQGTAGGNEPADCDWPLCGCDPYANKVTAALDEAGLELIKKNSLETAIQGRMTNARRCSDMADEPAKEAAMSMTPTRAELRTRANILRVARQMIVAHSQEEFNVAVEDMVTALTSAPVSRS